ncbi:hypothetical protein [Microbacterium gorillae]|uniref:hypothetical protein n=1 Tax=Microbacterium gorillae TaxID=1231063 RepID=UPI00058AC86F|nr:hypothetical protein [Microbacterium gorillae]
MFIVLAVIVGTVIGAVAQVMIPGRELRGLLVSGAIGAAVSALVYAIFTWTGVGEASIWTWVASIGLAAIAAIGGTVALTASRRAHDARERARLGIA